MMSFRLRLRRWLRVLLWLMALWLVFCVCLMAWVYAYGRAGRPQPADVIIVLGAGLRADGSPGFALTRRAEHAADLWRQGYAPRLICTGAQAYRRPRSEAAACAEILRRQGVPETAIVLETRSRSTQENALYARQVMQSQGWQTAIIVTDSYHLFRAHLIFQREGLTFSESGVPPERVRDPFFYAHSLAREVVALHWLLFVWLFNLSVTYVPLI
ncbi:MAG: YdcF family protein [Anaerolineae bacterium]|jgi:uncharacterized SAM-binding protein YcdF (DUF218 family)|nr:YdcF family protein [Anaerolineae bacterium]